MDPSVATIGRQMLFLVVFLLTVAFQDAQYMKMSLEILLLIVFGVLTSVFALFQLCIMLHKYCVWCRESRLNLNRQAEVFNLESIEIDQEVPSPLSSNGVQAVSSSEPQLNLNRQVVVVNVESVDQEGHSQPDSGNIQAVSSSDESFISCLEGV